MTLKEFREYIENFEDGKQFNYGISKPFMWRGHYGGDVGFTILTCLMTKEEILEKISMAYDHIFDKNESDDNDEGYTFNDYTKLHFEKSEYDFTCTDNYCEKMIRKIQGNNYESPEMRFVKLIFCDEPNDKHKARHIELHKSLDELVADFIMQTGKLSHDEISLIELAKWSYEQTQNPTNWKEEQ